MSFRSAPVLVLLVLGAGCWPRIPGQWKDYNVPDETILLGQMYWLELLGDYWSSGDPSGVAWWALLDPATPIRPEELFGERDVCVLDHDAGDLTSQFADGGSGTARLMQGDHEVRLTWDSSIDWYAAELEEGDFIFDASYDLAPTEFDPHGTLEIEGLLKTPSDFTLDAPLLDTEVAPQLNADQLVFEWSGDGGEDWFLIDLQLLDIEQMPLERVSCLVKNNGSYTVPADIWTRWDSSTLLFITIGPFEETGAPAPFAEGGMRFGALYQKMGAAFTHPTDAAER
jgi:hypothetical protein